MIVQQNQYKNVFIFPTGKPFVEKKQSQLIEKVNNFNDYIAAVEFMVKNFKSVNQKESPNNPPK